MRASVLATVLLLACCRLSIMAQPAGEAPEPQWAVTDTTVAPVAPTFTADELDSPMMRLDTPAVESKSIFNISTARIIDWGINHMLLSALVVNVLLWLLLWSIYRLCRYFFITRKP